MRARYALFLLLFFGWMLPGMAQSPIRVTVCDLMKSPQEYTGKVVEVRALVDLAFEDFSLDQNGCEDGSPGVWLVYGGDVPTPTASTVNDLERKPGSVLRIEGIPIPLTNDPALALFKSRLNAKRLSPIGERPCYDCHLFRVTATLRGMFFAAKKDKNSFEGYGHLGCCHLLAIEQVMDVAAERTPIPFGGKFACSSDKKPLTPAEAQRLHSFDRPCGDLSYTRCEELNSQKFAAAAAYWDDAIQAGEGTSGGGEIEGNRLTDRWESVDKLKVYTIEIDSESPSNPDGKTNGGSIARETCQAVVPPLAASATPNCQNLWSEFPVDDSRMERTHGNTETVRDRWRRAPAEQAARAALKIAAAEWKVDLAPNIQPDHCDKPMVYEGDQFTWCSWSDPDGMQTFSIQVTRFGRMRKGRSWEEAPWVLTRGNGVACVVEP